MSAPKLYKIIGFSYVEEIDGYDSIIIIIDQKLQNCLNLNEVFCTAKKTLKELQQHDHDPQLLPKVKVCIHHDNSL